MRNSHSPRRLLVYFALPFTCSWTCWLLAPVVNDHSSFVGRALFFPGGFGPSLAAVAVVSMSSGRAGLRTWLTGCLQWRGSWDWMTLACLAPLAVLTLAVAIYIALVGVLPPSPAVGHVALLLANFGLVFLVGGPLGEEFGWRIYALPAMQLHIGSRNASLVLGVIWGMWHLPLFFVAGSSQYQGSIAAFFVLIVATSVFYSWLLNRSAGSVVPVLPLHTASNSWPSVIPILSSNADQRPYLLVIGIVVITAIWLLCRRERHESKRALAS